MPVTSYSKVLGLSAIKTRSSAYKRALTWHNPKVMPLASLFRQSIKSLIKILNRVGDKGHLASLLAQRGWGGTDYYSLLWYNLCLHIVLYGIVYVVIDSYL